MKALLRTLMVAALFSFAAKANAQSGTLIFREGNNGSQNIVANITDAPGQAYNLKDRNSIGKNDEARSVVMENVRVGAVLTVYDSPNGDASDDYCVITVKQLVSHKVIGSFETSFEDNEVKVQKFKNGNLDGNVSFIRVN